METYTEARPLVSNPSYDSDRDRALGELRSELSKGSIDEPILDVLERFASLLCCFTLQSCYGHFTKESLAEDRNTERVADIAGTSTQLHYRIAYVALCVQNSPQGRALLEELGRVPEVNPDYIQFGSADWFWKSWVNSYVLQVSPLSNAHQDHFNVDMEETLRIERARDGFFARLRAVLSEQ